MAKDRYILHGEDVLLSYKDGIEHWAALRSEEAKSATRYSPKEAATYLKQIKQAASYLARNARIQGEVDHGRELQADLLSYRIISNSEFLRLSGASGEKP